MVTVINAKFLLFLEIAEMLNNGCYTFIFASH